MEILNLLCPSCKAHLTLPADKSENENLILVCPKCNFKGNPSSFIKLQPFVSPVKQVEDAKISEPTIIVGPNVQMALSIGRLKEIKTLKIFQLHQGVNLFGRKSSSSNCDHQFSNNDSFISRKHFEVNVVFNKATLIYDHRLQDIGSVNGTVINGQKLIKGDIILLRAGDRILAGKTELIFEFPISLDDTMLV